MKSKLRVVWHYIKARNTKRLKSRAAIEAYQRKGIERLCKHLETKSTFYRALLEEGNGFKSLPIMDKQLMMANFDDLVCVDITKEEAFDLAMASEQSRDFSDKHNGLTVGLSSGTSDHRGVFLASEIEADIWTGSILGRLLPNMKGHQEIAFFLRANSTLYENVKTKKIGFTYYDIYEPIEKHIETLNRTKPGILIAPPSVLMVLAEAVEQGVLKLQLSKLISVAEVLEEEDAVYFKRLFKQKVIHQVYQCTEGFLAYTCEFGTLHINEDMVMIEEEPIDENRYMPIITDFTRRSQPIVRYRLNDVLVRKQEPCPCGCHFKSIEKIEGREDDVFMFERKTSTGMVKVFPDMIRRCVLYVDGIRHYQVIQEKNQSLTILLSYEAEAKKAKVEEAVVEAFNNLGRQLMVKIPEIRFGAYEHKTDVKLKRVMRL